MYNRKFYILYLSILMPTITLIIGLSTFYYYEERSAVIDTLKTAENIRLMFKKNVFEDEFQSIVSDLFILSSHQQIGLLANGSLDVDYIALAQEFYIFSQSKKKI